MAIIRATTNNNYETLANGQPFRRDAITIRGRYVDGVPNNGWNMSNYYEYTKVGNKLSCDGGIKIGAGIKKILVSSNTFMDIPGLPNYLWYFLMKKDTNGNRHALGNFISQDNTNVNFLSCSIAPVLVNVQEGDVIYGYYDQTFNTGAGVNIRADSSTYITAEVVEYE